MISILIVEDEFLTADFIKDTLTEIGYEISGIASSASECLTLLEETKTDLVFLDIHINGDIDGIQLAHTIKEKYDIPYIFLTSYLDKKTVDAALESGPSAYITKPFNKISLYSSIEVALSNYSQGRVATSSENVPVKEKDKTILSDSFLFVKHKGTFAKIEIDDILYFHSELKCVDIYTEDKRHTIRHSLPELLNKFNRNHFIRCHRSYAVNLNKVVEIDSSTIYFQNKIKIPISLSYKKAVISHIDLL